MCPTKLSLKDAQNALAGHIVEKALEVREKYSSNIDYDTLLDILKDKNCVRYPTEIKFSSESFSEGLFAVVQKKSDQPEDGFVIFVHEYFQNRLEDVVALVVYYLVAVNYGDLATANDAELFGSTVLGMEQEKYYQLVCHLADEIN